MSQKVVNMRGKIMELKIICLFLLQKLFNEIEFVINEKINMHLID